MSTHKPNSKYETLLSPFHRGEKELQTRIGEREKMESIGNKIIRSYMPDQHREFFSQLTFLIVGSVDEEGWPWASILLGSSGFISSPTPTTLEIKTDGVITGDPLAESLNRLETHLGFVGIELSTRRRNRLNGRVTGYDNNVTVKVDQSFGNCPQYIEQRNVAFGRDVADVKKHQRKQVITTIDSKAHSLIRAADTFFVASYIQPKNNPKIEGVDVSHRGGDMGFIKIKGNTLIVPDYSGNNLFNTLGNFLITPRAGLVFIDFLTGELLMLTGTVELLWEEDKAVKNGKETSRYWRFTLNHGIRFNNALSVQAN